jgi:peptide deformylase
MARLTVLTVPDSRLKLRATPVEAVNDSIRQLMNDMLETMHAEDGIGLAATQVGVQKRVIVMEIPDMDEKKPEVVYKMANPEIIWVSDEVCNYDEGCLSVPGQRAQVERPSKVKIRFLDENNKQQELEGDDILARCIQHEIDHLDGKLYIDYLTPLKKQLLVKKAQRFSAPVTECQKKDSVNL